MKQVYFTKKMLLSIRNNQHGISLIEVIVSLALLAIVAVFICNTLLVGVTILSRARNKTKNSMQTAGGVVDKSVDSSVSAPSGTNVTSSSGSFTITFTNGNTTTTENVSGSYVTGTTSGSNGNDNVTYKNFVPAQ